MEVVVVAAAVDDLIAALKRTNDALSESRKQDNDRVYGLSYLSRSLERLHDMLAHGRNQWNYDYLENTHLDVVPLLRLCVSSCKILITYIDVLIQSSSSTTTWSGAGRLIVRLKREFWGWRLGTKVTRQNEGFELLFQAMECKAMNLQSPLLTEREMRRIMSRVQNDANVIMRTTRSEPIYRRVVAWFGRGYYFSSTPDNFIRSLCDRTFSKPLPKRHLRDYITISDPARRSQYIDSTLAEELRCRREECRMIIMYGCYDGKDRIFAELNNLRPEARRIATSEVPRLFLEVVFPIGHIKGRIHDIPRRGERKKFIHLYEQTDAILFVVNLASYVEHLIEDYAINVFREWVILFDSIVTSRWFKSSSYIFVLDNVDEFERMLRVQPLRQHFPEYSGTSDVREAVSFILDMFRKVNREGRSIYPIFSSFNHTSNTRSICSAVEEIMLLNKLKERLRRPSAYQIFGGSG